jgi:hypothetical protein
VRVRVRVDWFTALLRARWLACDVGGGGASFGLPTLTNPDPDSRRIPPICLQCTLVRSVCRFFLFVCRSTVCVYILCSCAVCDSHERCLLLFLTFPQHIYACILCLSRVMIKGGKRLRRFETRYSSAVVMLHEHVFPAFR